MQHVITFASFHGWRVYHPFYSKRSEPGWPDLFLVRGKRAVAIECKVGRGRVTASQQEWVAALRTAGIPTYVLWPDQETEMRDILR